MNYSWIGSWQQE